ALPLVAAEGEGELAADRRAARIGGVHGRETVEDLARVPRRVEEEARVDDLSPAIERPLRGRAVERALAGPGRAVVGIAVDLVLHALEPVHEVPAPEVE